MALRDRRAALALVLTVLALAVPCGAWYLVGSREAQRQADDLAAAARRNAHETAVRLATQLTQRLNNLRDAESRRPFYHYQAFFHDPQVASQGASVAPSPLTTAPSDPLVLVYFQADGASGRVSLPAASTVAQSAAEPTTTAQRDTLHYLQHQLERGVASILFAVRGESLPQQTIANEKPSAPKGQSKTEPPAQPLQAASQWRSNQQSPPAQGQRVEVLEKRAWVQNLDAAALYSNLKQPNPNQKEIANLADLQQQGNVEIFVGALKWRTLYVEGEPALAALREVTTPQGAVLQGFLVSPTGLTDFFRPAGLPARLQPGAPETDLQAPLAIGDDPWRVSVDAHSAQSAAEQQARGLRRGFLTIFLGGVGLAALAGLAVVWLVWQSERLARQRAQFAASAAHELRTPLAGLRIFSEMLAEGLGDPTKARDYARRVADEAERLGRVVANVLGFTRLERGTLVVHPVSGDLAATVRDSVARQQPALEALHARVEVSIDADLPPVRFDRDALSQILQNLLDNAEKHTRFSENRTIHVSLNPVGRAVSARRLVPESRTARRAVPTGDAFIELAIADHGPGVARKARRKLFQPFVRGDEPDAPAGIGLGLVLVKTLTEAQGGTVAYRDNDGGGARFAVRLPV